MHRPSRVTPQKSLAANAATLALYEALNDEQKKTADQLILGMGMM